MNKDEFIQRAVLALLSAGVSGKDAVVEARDVWGQISGNPAQSMPCQVAQIVADQISNPGSVISRALSRNIEASRRRL